MNKNIEISTYYRVYEFVNVLGNAEYKALKEVYFSNGSSQFETEQQAVEALVTNNKTYDNYIILKEFYLR